MAFRAIITKIPSSRVRKCFKSYGSGRVRSGQKVFILKRIGSGRVGSAVPDPTRPDPRGMTRPVNNPWISPNNFLPSFPFFLTKKMTIPREAFSTPRLYPAGIGHPGTTRYNLKREVATAGRICAGMGFTLFLCAGAG